MDVACSEMYTDYENTICGKQVVFLNFKPAGIRSIPGPCNVNPVREPINTNYVNYM